MNKTMQVVRLTSDPELKYTQSGTAICNFSGAYNKKYKDQEQVSYFNYVAWGKTAELINQYVKKGQQLGIESEAQQDRWEDQNGNKRSAIKFNVREITFIGNKSDNGNGNNQNNSQSNDMQNSPFDDDLMPF